jgi:regulatory protein
MDEKNGKAALDVALRLLAGRAHGRREIEDKLRKKGFEAEAIAEALLRLDQLKLIDDRAFAGNFVAGMARRRPEGRLKTRARLKQKGLSDEIIGEAIATSDQKALCLSAAEKKLRTLAGSPEQKKKKLIAFLKNRGFEWETIREALKLVTGKEDEDEMDLMD